MLLKTYNSFQLVDIFQLSEYLNGRVDHGCTLVGQSGKAMGSETTWKVSDPIESWEGGEPTILAADDPERLDYIRRYNRPDIVMARINEPEQYREKLDQLAGKTKKELLKSQIDSKKGDTDNLLT